MHFSYIVDWLDGKIAEKIGRPGLKTCLGISDCGGQSHQTLFTNIIKLPDIYMVG